MCGRTGVSWTNLHAEVLEYDDAQRSGRFVHPETMPDDALHATNYALLVGVRGFQGQKHHMEGYSYD